MRTRMTARGQVTVPQRLRRALRLAPGDAMEFHLRDNGELVLRKVAASQADGRRHGESLQAPPEEQMRRHAEELIALLRGLD